MCECVCVSERERQRVCMCVCVERVSMYTECHGVCLYGCQRTFGSWFSPTPLWVLGIDLRVSGLAASAFTSWATTCPGQLHSWTKVNNPQTLDIMAIYRSYWEIWYRFLFSMVQFLSSGHGEASGRCGVQALWSWQIQIRWWPQKVGGLKAKGWEKEKKKNIEFILGQLYHPLKNDPKHIPKINCEIPEKCGCV